MHQVPRLLVSVRDAEEACAALAGGVDIVDVKEPARGPLGMADAHVIGSVVDAVVAREVGVRCSAALGEVTDWCDVGDVPALPGGLHYAKLGLSGLARAASWRDDWETVRRRFEEASTGMWEWIAVAYADRDAADSPELDEIIAAAAGASCAGVLIDTFDKRSGDLLTHLGSDSLCGVAEQCHASGLFLAVAGRLSEASLPVLAGTACDVVGIRSAACDGRDRSAAVRSDCVAAFRQRMQEAFSHAEDCGDRGREAGVT